MMNTAHPINIRMLTQLKAACLIKLLVWMCVFLLHLSSCLSDRLLSHPGIWHNLRLSVKEREGCMEVQSCSEIKKVQIEIKWRPCALSHKDLKASFRKTEKKKSRRRGCQPYFGVPAWADFEKGILIASVGCR